MLDFNFDFSHDSWVHTWKYFPLRFSPVSVWMIWQLCSYISRFFFHNHPVYNLIKCNTFSEIYQTCACMAFHQNPTLLFLQYKNLKNVKVNCTFFISFTHKREISVLTSKTVPQRDPSDIAKSNVVCPVPTI